MIKGLHQLVKTEAENIRKLATKEELSRLNIKKLNSDDVTLCIYGQMTKNCHNERAVELIKNSCEKVYAPKDPSSFNLMSDLKIVKKPKYLNRLDVNSRVHWSPIEVFIYQKENQLNDNNRRLVNYLKGKSPTLIFE